MSQAARGLVALAQRGKDCDPGETFGLTGDIGIRLYVQRATRHVELRTHRMGAETILPPR